MHPYRSASPRPPHASWLVRLVIVLALLISSAIFDAGASVAVETGACVMAGGTVTSCLGVDEHNDDRSGEDDVAPSVNIESGTVITAI